ncbi:NADPH:quinone reductase [Sulfitobacter sp. HNIBRBA3233]|uniref:NADPH:quinone reductase n=1 Tax=Sulfitobacter marinivivus TaxID=3158558 RepID=UPI0032DF67E4
MRAATYRQTGPAADVLDVAAHPQPEPGPGEVLVRVMASGINPADVKRRGGWNGARMEHALVIPHCDGAGVIEAVGAGVARDRIGQRVWMWNAQGGYGESGRAFGTAAEYIALASAQAVPLSDTLGFDEGACLGVPGLTAWLAVLGDGDVAGRTLLIQGAAGAVGQMCVQVAAAAGARVIATVSNAEAAETVRRLGAGVAIDRHAEDVADAVATATGGAGVDRIVEVDLAANLETDIACLAPGGMIASYSCSSDPTPVLPYYALANLGARIRFVQGFRLTDAERREAEAMIARLTDAGQLCPQIGARYPLEDIAAAHQRVESGAAGQTVLFPISQDRSPT